MFVGNVTVFALLILAAVGLVAILIARNKSVNHIVQKPAMVLCATIAVAALCHFSVSTTTGTLFMERV